MTGADQEGSSTMEISGNKCNFDGNILGELFD